VDLKLRITKYKFEPNAFLSGTVSVASFSQFGGVFFKTDILHHEQTSEPLKLSAVEALGFLETMPPMSGTLPDSMLEFCALRFSFRDPTTGKYFYYCRATSIVKPMFPDEPEFSGRSGFGGNPLLGFDDVPEVIKEHQCLLYKNEDAEEYRSGID
jgi:hypothetical protein